MIKSIIFNILGIVCLNIPASGMFAKVLALFGGILIIVGLLIALINFVLSLTNFKQNIPKFVFSIISLGLGVYGMIQVIQALPLIKSMF